MQRMSSNFSNSTSAGIQLKEERLNNLHERRITILAQIRDTKKQIESLERKLQQAKEELAAEKIKLEWIEEQIELLEKGPLGDIPIRTIRGY